MGPVEANRGVRARVRAAGKALEGDGRQTDNSSIIVRCSLTLLNPVFSKGAIASKIKHAIKHKTSPARLAQLLHNCCSPH